MTSRLGMLLLLLPTPVIAADLPSAEEVRVNAREAVGFVAFQKLKDGIAYEGKAEFLGIPGTFRSRLCPDGRYTRVIDAKGEQAVGFDGTTRWGRNFSGPVMVLEMEEADRDRYLFGILCQRWLAEDGGFVVVVDPKATTDERVGLTLSHPNAGVVARLTLNRTTWRPEQLTIPGSMTTRVIDFSDYRDLSGVKLPTRIVVAPYSGGQWIFAQTGEVCKPGEKNPYGPPAVGRLAEVDPVAPAKLEARRMDEGRLLLVRPVVNGNQTPWFIFDTGSAMSLISPSAADSLKLPTFGGSTVVGVGRAKVRFRQSEAFALGPVTVGKMVLGELPQEFADEVTRRAGVQVGGLIGCDFLFRAVVEVNHEAGAISAFDPATYKLPAGAVWETIHFNTRMPCVKGTFEGKHEGLFLFDTGHEAKLTFNVPAVQQLKLLANRETSPCTVVGIGGTLVVQRGSATEFQVLGRTIKPIAARFATEPKGLYGDPYTLGTFGLAALGSGVVVFDYPNRRIAFVPKP